MKVSILIPCHNEEKTIKKALQSVLNQTRPIDEIIVVDDASTDKSVQIIKRMSPKIKLIQLTQPSGSKSYVQERGLKSVTGDIFITADADTILDPKFTENILKSFKNQKVIAVSGYVKSLKHNWLTAVRELDYIVGQDLHKRAQSYIGALFVIPGCAAAFRTKIFRKNIQFDHDTLTEDMDFTYKLNKLEFKIDFNKNAVVYTQDPDTLNAYVNQLRRWYGGNWQNLFKHLNIVKNPIQAWELTLVHLEGLISSSLFLLLPLFNMRFFLIYLMFYLLYTKILTIYGAITHKRKDLLFYGGFYMLMAFVNSYIFVEQFFIQIILGKENLVWYKPERRVFA